MYSNERGAIIDAQLTQQEEQRKEIERCLDFNYYYINYCRIVTVDGKIVKPINRMSMSNDFIAILEQTEEGYFRRIR